MEDLRTEVIPQDQPPRASASYGCLRLFIDVFETILLALVLFLGINAISARVRVENISMQPTLQSGEFVLVNKIAYKYGTAQHGDIIVFHYPGNPAEDYIKRVIGLPGDLVAVSGGIVTVNGIPLDEPYIAEITGYNGEWRVPENQFFVLGDNRNSSSDSHIWGYVPFANVVGKALVVYWPINDLQWLEHPDIVQASR